MILRNFLNLLICKKKCVGYLSSMYFAGESASGSENICDLFARFFGEVYADEGTDIQYQGVGGPVVLRSGRSARIF
jgi:hypothetical protein